MVAWTTAGCRAPAAADAPELGVELTLPDGVGVGEPVGEGDPELVGVGDAVGLGDVELDGCPPDGPS